MSDLRRDFVQPLLSVLLGLIAGLLITAFAGENPMHVLSVLVKSAVGSPYDLGMTLFYSTPLIFTGLSVAVAFHSGLFNIGGEGQLAMGALAAAAVGILFPSVPWPLAPILAIIAAFAAGAMWGFIPGWLRAYRGSHEVINTIMLNFIAAGIASYVTLYLLKNPDSQAPETSAIAPVYAIAKLPFSGDAPVNVSLVLALICAAGVSTFLWRTVLGFELRAVGQSEPAARQAGISPARMQVLAMMLAGGLAGLVGVNEVLGAAYRFKIDFSPGYGFLGIAVALLGRNRPSGVIAAALLFGALHKGTADLDIETENVTRDLSLIMQSFIILSVSAEGLWDWIGRSKISAKGSV
jgi:ABC-type uncharacterized transport system permease subunit